MDLVKIPSLIDVHVHLREPGATQKEDFETGTKAAISGGYTQVLDMPNNTPSVTSEKYLDNKIKLAKGRIYCDLGFNFGGNKKSTKQFSKIYKKAFALKVYMNRTTGTLLVDDNVDRELVFHSWKSSLPIMVHAEGQTLKMAIKLAKKYQRKLHACHISLDQIEIIEKAKMEKVEISCEVCPHHLFLSKEDLKTLGPFGIMKPPLLSESDRKMLWKHLDKIDMISTDHAPHTLDEKFDHSSPKFGVPGLETTIPLFFEAMRNKMISLERFVKMTHDNPNKVFNLPRQMNTYVIVDRSKHFKISQMKLFTKCNWTPFKNLTGGAKVAKVVLRGKVVYANGEFNGKPQGKVIYPNV